MGTEAERSVIISLKLLPDPKNQATASLVSSQAQSVSQAGNDAYEKLKTIAGESEKQISEIQKIQAAIRTDIDKQEHGERISLMEDTLSRLAFLGEEWTKSQETEADKRDKQRQSNHDKQVKEAKELAEKLQKAEETRVSSQQKAKESAAAAVQGMADMVEGAAKLGLVSEDNFEKFTKNFNMIQEGIRVFKGITDVIWKTREGLIALGTATKAQVAVNELLAASQAKAAVASTAAGTASVAGGTATLAGGGLAAGGAAIWVGTKVMAGLALVAAKLLAIGAVFTEVIQGIARTVEWITGLDFGEWTESVSLATLDMRKAQKIAAEHQKKTEADEKKKIQLIEARTRFENDESKKATLAGDLRSAQVDVDDARQIAAGGGRGDDSERERIKVLNEIRVAEQAILEDRRIQEERIAAGHFQSINNRERVMKNLEDAQGRLLDLEKNRLNVITDQKKQIAEQLKTEREKLQVAKDALKSEEQRLQERFGRLTKIQRHRVDQVSQKHAAGQQLTKQDIKDLEEAGLAGTIASKFFARLGVQAGGNRIFNRLGLLKKRQSEVNNVSGSEQKKQQELGQKTAQEDQQQARFIDAAERNQRIVNKRVGLNIESSNIAPEEVEGFKQDQKLLINEIQQIAADGSDNITQRSMEVADALGANLAAMNDGLDGMKKAIEKNRFKKDAYKK